MTPSKPIGVRFHDKRGQLTPYALACGYVQSYSRDDIATRLDHEGSVFHVRTHDHRDNKRLAWETFTRLTDARREYARQKRLKRIVRIVPMTDLDGAFA